MFEGIAERLSVPSAIGVIPTDTIYGVVARASDRAAVARLYALKQRDSKPGTVIAADADDLARLGIEWRHLEKISRFWPGPVSVETPHEVAYLHQGTGRQALRVPHDADLLAMLKSTGPLLTSSANPPGATPATTMSEAVSYFGDAVDFYVDGGDLSGRAPSTIIKLADDGIEVIREGAVRIDDAGKNKHEA